MKLFPNFVESSRGIPQEFPNLVDLAGNVRFCTFPRNEEPIHDSMNPMKSSLGTTEFLWQELWEQVNIYGTITVQRQRTLVGFCGARKSF